MKSIINRVSALCAPLYFRAIALLAAVAILTSSASVSFADPPTALPPGGYTPSELQTIAGFAATRWGEFLAVGLLFMLAVGVVKKGIRMITGLWGAKRAGV